MEPNEIEDIIFVLQDDQDDNTTEEDTPSIDCPPPTYL